VHGIDIAALSAKAAFLHWERGASETWHSRRNVNDFRQKDRGGGGVGADRAARAYIDLPLLSRGFPEIFGGRFEKFRAGPSVRCSGWPAP
jgi:hypothetical protein